MMQISRVDNLYSYIAGKKKRLEDAKKIAPFIAAAVWLVALGLWAGDLITMGDMFLLALVASFWASIQGTVCIMHIDALHVLHRDLDRDRAEGLEGFETP